MQRSIKLDAINSYLICTLCRGYLVDATTLVECLHSFCRSCLVKYLENSHDCPKCSMEIHKTKPFDYIRSDPCLQEIVYKLVPDLFSSEEKRKRSWKKLEATEEEKGKENHREQSSATAHAVVQPGTPDESRILVTLKYFRGTSRFERIKTEKVLQMFPTRYLCCNPEMPVRVLKKFVCLKYDVSLELFNIELWRGDETLCEELTLKQLVQIYGLFRERKPLDLHFSLYPKFEPTTANKELAVEEKGKAPPLETSEEMVQNTAGTEEDIIDAVLSHTDEKDQCVSDDNEKSMMEDNVMPNQEQEQQETSSIGLATDSKPNNEKFDKVLDAKSSDSDLHTDSMETEEKSESMELCKEKITEVKPIDDQVEKVDTLAIVEDKACSSAADDCLILKEELKKLTAKNNLNTTDSDSSQKSNVSSLDVNLLMDDDFKPDLLQSEFLNLFDSDSQHNSDMDTSGMDHNVSIDSTAGTTNNKRASDLVQNQTSVFEIEKCENLIEACDQKSATSPIAMPSDVHSSSPTLSKCNNDDSRLFIPTRATELLDIGENDMLESHSNFTKAMPQLPGVSTVSNFKLDVPSNVITENQSMEPAKPSLRVTFVGEGSKVEPVTETHISSTSDNEVAHCIEEIRKYCESTVSPHVSPVKPTSNSNIDNSIDLSKRDLIFDSVSGSVDKSLGWKGIKDKCVPFVVSSCNDETGTTVAGDAMLTAPPITVTDFTVIGEAGKTLKTSTPLITSCSAREDEKRQPLVSPMVESSEHSFLRSESIFSVDPSPNSTYRALSLCTNNMDVGGALTLQASSQGDGGTVKLHHNLTTTSTTTTTTASSITAVTTTTASVSNRNPSTLNTDKMSALREREKMKTSFTNKKMIASLIDCRVTISDLPNLDQLRATTNNMTRHEQNSNGASNTTSSNSSNSSTNGCMSTLDSSTCSSLNNVNDSTDERDEIYDE